MLVFWEALQIYRARHGRYGDAWTRYGWLDSLFHIRNKTTRMDFEFYHHPPEDHAEALARLDNPLDLINYAAFFIRNVRNDNERGEDA